MRPRHLACPARWLLIPVVIALAAADRPSTATPKTASSRAAVRLEAHYGDLPLAFEPNAGQTDPQVRFLTRAPGMIVFFTDTEAVMVLHKSVERHPGPSRRREAAPNVEQQVVRMKLAGANTPQQATGLERLPGVSNYFIGNDPRRWQRTTCLAPAGE